MRKTLLFIVAVTFIFLGITRLMTANSPSSQSGPVAMTKELQDQMTPAQILQKFKEGNQRYLQGKMFHRDYVKEKDIAAAGQHPYAMILSCIDSRTPAEIIFDKGIGDVFNARIAGNFVNTDILGSMEFATKVSGAKLILIMGHTNCGAIKSAVDNVQLGNITALLSNIKPAVESVTGVPGDRTSKNAKFVEAVAKQNVLLAKKNITDKSPIIKEMVTAAQVMIVGCMYDLETGAVTFYND